MTGMICNPMETKIYTASWLTELVRGTDRDLLEKLAPMVREQNVSLDLSHVERIDAAGIATLISLYGQARETGHEFAAVNASARVTEILALVGLDRILLSQNAVPDSQFAGSFERPAA